MPETHDVRQRGLYRPVGEETTAELGELISSRTPVFVMPSWFVNTEAAQVGHLLSEALTELTGGAPGGRGSPYRSFFANSRYEAVHAAVKLTRHAGLAGYGDHGGRFAVLDPDPMLHASFDPLGDGPQRALVPGVDFVRSIDALRKTLREGKHCGVLLREPSAFDPERLACAAAEFREAASHGVLVTLDLSDSALTHEAAGVLGALSPDLVIVGERLTGYEVPFAALVGTPEAFAPWDRAETAFLHSSTYGGNTLAMRRVRAALLARFAPGAPVHATVARAEADWDFTLRLYGRHVNATTEKMHRALHGTLHVVRAEGARLTLELDSGRRLEVVDGACGGGLGVAGHNADDARTAVLEQHDPAGGHGARLEELLARDTSLARVFPGVSGATAVENALTLALLARRGSRKVIVFDHNYGGKTLISLLATAAENSRAPFGPLYDSVRYLDPFAPDAVDRLKDELDSGDVALVWLELVHGSSDSYAPLPDELLDVIAQERERRGFLIGVDEILTSYYRCGPRFAHHGRLPEVDLVTVSKALSYMCFPVSAAVVSEDVARRAREANPRLVEELRHRYANSLGAHFAVHSLTRADELGLAGRTASLAGSLRSAVESIDPASRTVGNRFAQGLFVRLEMRPPKLPGALAKKAGELSLVSTLLWWTTRARVFSLYDCLGLPLTSGPEEEARFVDGIRALSRKSPYSLLWSALVFVAGERLRTALARRRRRRTPGAANTRGG